MSLRSFHIVFIVCSTTLAVLLAAWNFRRAVSGGPSFFLIGVLATLAATALIVYGIWFWRKIETAEQARERRRRLMSSAPAVLAAILFGLPDTAHACEVCYGAADNAMIDGARVGVFLLLGVVFAVQAGFVVFFVYLIRRARRYGPQDVAPWWSTVEEPAKR